MKLNKAIAAFAIASIADMAMAVPKPVGTEASQPQAQTAQQQAMTPQQPGAQAQQVQQPVAPPPIIVPRAKLPPDVVPPGALAKQVGEAVTDYTVNSNLTPSQIDDVKDSVQGARRVQSYPYPQSYVPKPVNRRIEIGTDLLLEPQMVNTVLGMLTTFVFLDNEGSPWPIADVSFDADMFKSPDAEKGGGSGNAKPSNILRLQPKQPYAYANLVVTLQGRDNSPITFIVNTGHGQTVDVRIDARVEGRNPAAIVRPSSVTNGVSHDPYLDAFLYGQIPSEARPLYINGDPKLKTAWLFRGSIYLRTTNDLITPAYNGIGGMATGLKVYKIQTVRTLLWSVNGKPQMVTLNETPEYK